MEQPIRGLADELLMARQRMREAADVHDLALKTLDYLDLRDNPEASVRWLFEKACAVIKRSHPGKVVGLTLRRHEPDHDTCDWWVDEIHAEAGEWPECGKVHDSTQRILAAWLPGRGVYVRLCDKADRDTILREELIRREFLATWGQWKPSDQPS